MIYFVAIVLTVIYLTSVFGCISYFVDNDVDMNMLTLFILLCPILNTFFAFKGTNFKETIQKLKGGKE